MDGDEIISVDNVWIVYIIGTTVIINGGFLLSIVMGWYYRLLVELLDGIPSGTLVGDELSVVDAICLRMVNRISLIWDDGGWFGTLIQAFLDQCCRTTSGAKVGSRTTDTHSIINYINENKLTNGKYNELHGYNK